MYNVQIQCKPKEISQFEWHSYKSSYKSRTIK